METLYFCRIIGGVNLISYTLCVLYICHTYPSEIYLLSSDCGRLEVEELFRLYNGSKNIINIAKYTYTHILESILVVTLVTYTLETSSEYVVMNVVCRKQLFRFVQWIYENFKTNMIYKIFLYSKEIHTKNIYFAQLIVRAVFECSPFPRIFSG